MGDYDQDESIEEGYESGDLAQQEAGAATEDAKPRRRSKNDNCTRSYKCGCGKDYLSYPALYTHVKQKHGGVNPNGTDSSAMRSHRGRGRPRKQNFPTVSASRPQTDDTFLKQEGFLGGPCNPVDEYALCSYPCANREEDKIFAAVQSAKDQAVREEQPVCDEVFGLFLVDLATKVTREAYQMFVLFVQSLRTCFNEKALKVCQDFSHSSSDQEICESQTAQNLPEISNYFITEYLEEKVPELDRTKAIGMMLYFNAFLFGKKFSNLKLSLIANE